MVRVAFICEDDAGKKIIDSENFKQILQQNNLVLVPPVYNTKGKGNLTEENVRGLVDTSFENGAKYIFLLTDMDLDACITITKQNLIKDSACKIIVCKKAVEAWFLADTATLSSLLNQNAYFEYPETPNIPFDIINHLHKEAFDGRGISKSILPIKMIGKGFALANAASHENCTSARYFLQKLQSLAHILPV